MKKMMILLMIINSIASAETFDVSITNFKFTPNDLTIQVGDTVKWTNNQGTHNVIEDNDAFTSGNPTSDNFEFEHTFNSIEEVLYYCAVHSQPGLNIDTNMNGRINVVAGEETFSINQGMSGAWFFPETSGQGLLLEIAPAINFIFIAWFTYDVESESEEIGSSDNRWFTALGLYSGGLAKDLDIKHNFGGIFDNPQPVSVETIGKMTVEFTDCNTGMVSYVIDEGPLTGEFPIQRVISGTESLCEDLAAAESEK